MSAEMMEKPPSTLELKKKKSVYGETSSYLARKGQNYTQPVSRLPVEFFF